MFALKLHENVKKKSIPKKWFKFDVLSPTTAILRGSYSMSDKRFKFGSRGQQGAACSVIAIVFGCLCQPKEWTSNFVDQILKYGDKLFRTSQARNRIKPGIYMTTKLIYPEFFIEDYKCWVCIEDSCVFGNLFSENLGSPDLTDGLQRFFKTNNSGVLTAQENSVAIWRYLDKGFLYFDPSSCNELGVQSSNGVACVVRFKCLNDLRDLFLSNLNQKDNSRYCIDRVIVSKVKLVDQGIPINEKCIHADENVLKMLNPTEINEKIKDRNQTVVKENHKLFLIKEPFLITISNYNIDTVSAVTFIELPGDRAILHGLTHQLSDVYKGKGAQNVANCIAIFGMKKINPVKTWLRPRLDEILALGDNLYTETKAKYPMIQSLTAADYNNSQMIVSGKKLFNDVDLITIVGTLHSKDPSILSLKQALEEFFLVHKDGVIESSSMAVAIWTQDDYFYMFDPRECDANGVRMIANEKIKSSEKGKKKSTNGLSKKIEGKCCVMRFPSIDTLAVHILNNISSLKKNDRFTIRHISVMDDIPGTRMWNEFQPGEAGRTWILQGSISNDAEEFEDESRGFQGIAMPIVALVKAIEIPPNEWTSEIIDQVIREGDAYFNWCVSTEEEKDEEEDRELTLKNLKTKLYVDNRRVIINVDELLASGRIKPGDQVPNLADGLKKFFENHQHGIVELNNLSLAVWKHEIKNKSPKESEEIPSNVSYYCFDPNPRGKLGHQTPQDDEELVACVVRAVNLEEIARIIELNIDEKEEASDEFFIHGFKVDSISEPMTYEELIVDKKIPIRPDLNNYSELSEEVAYLAGSFTQGNTLQFKSRTRDKQQAANALVALAMSKLYNPHLWYQEVVDDILKLGDKITEENLDNLPEEEADVDKEQIKRDYLVPSEIDEFFDIGVNRATVEIEEGITSGMMKDIDTSVAEFFRTNQMGILRQDEIMIPIWKEGHTYFTFNPRGSSDQANLKEEKNNTAIVYWSTTIPSLVMIIKQFLNPDKNFTIDGITLENEYETRIAENERPKKSPSKENLWNNFIRFSDGMWKLVGDIAIDDERFEEKNRNNQTAAIAVISVLFSKIYEARQWNREILDEIVVIGDQLHSKSAERLGDNINLKVDQIIPEFYFSDRKLDLAIKDCVEVGKVNRNMLTGLENFFNEYVSGILTIAGINLAIWKATDIYYCIIPSHFRSLNNDSLDKNITAYRFQTLQLLINYLMNLFNAEEDYEMHAVDVIDWNKLPPWKFDPSTAVRPSNLPSLNAFKRFQGYARAILRGGIHQGSNIFPEAIRNQQTAANCVVALAMTLVKNPVTWIKETMDEILVIGLNVHQESLQSKSSLMKLKPSDIIRVFQVGENVLVSDIEAETITGQVSLEPPAPDVKGKKAKKVKPTKAKGKKRKVQKRERPPPPPPILLKEGLKTFFDSNKAGVLVVGHYMIALWKDQGVYFIYDPRGRNDQGEKDDLGASCTMWFAYLEPLYDLIYTNIDEFDRYRSYEICRAIIRTTIIEPLPNPVGFQSCSASHTPTEKTGDLETASEFYYIDKEASILLGNSHMHDESFDVSSRGFQSTAIAAVAIVVSLLHVPSTWTAELVDSIINYGNILNQDSMRMVRSGPRTLSPCELLDVFVVGDFKANIYIHRHTAAGILLVHDLTQALILFFKNNCAGILHTPDIAVAVMQHYGKFYMLDPRECDKFGRLSYDGSACVTKCKNIMRLASQFVNNCNYKVPCVYTINAVDVLNLQFFSDTINVNSLK
ncbi:uncharacterized protein [Chelonus insularis]|uniref:uncharacterized protein n=1 Tax=Chelonus insularis TaxID=460826 RepID=UPI00158EF329|nr:uncharacterized protein LOC118072785 [Chelonus insularis]